MNTCCGYKFDFKNLKPLLFLYPSFQIIPNLRQKKCQKKVIIKNNNKYMVSYFLNQCYEIFTHSVYTFGRLGMP